MLGMSIRASWGRTVKGDTIGVPVPDALVVGDHHQGGVGRFTVEQVHDGMGVFIVQGRGGFIGEDHLGSMQEGARDGGPLLLSNTEFVGEGVASVRNVQPLQHGIHPLGEIYGYVAMRKLVGQGQIFFDGQAVHEVGLLEDNAQG